MNKATLWLETYKATLAVIRTSDIAVERANQAIAAVYPPRATQPRAGNGRFVKDVPGEPTIDSIQRYTVTTATYSHDPDAPHFSDIVGP